MAETPEAPETASTPADQPEPKAKAAESEPTAEPAAKTATKAAKKEAKPTVESKPFAEFIKQDFIPALEKAFAAKEYQDLELSFANNQVAGTWDDGQKQFILYFPDGDIQGRKAFSEASNGIAPSTIESFLIDERKVTLDLLVFGVVQRINAQKWFGSN
ncbi:MAG: DUF2996 domain-containing protein [Aphanocapsa sp. GSE-SYN-MK-11-07L]|jgi:pyruvate/2-oxoglutarate dehydrogenase complex dihydrolipoamide acyltransferase (E2) component|nr:DUF2996 domain-containing protein [Aphanocapsa sp. GSE-SYN-MK-11-07L]